MDKADTDKSPESRSSSSPEIVDVIPAPGCSREPSTIEKPSSSSNQRTISRRLIHICKYVPETEKMVVVGRYYETKDIPLTEATPSGSGEGSETVDSEVIAGSMSEDKSPSPEIVEIPYTRPTPRLVELSSSSSDERISPDDASIVCQICNQSFASQLCLEDHEIRHHMKDVVFLCNICKQRFITVDRLQNHECIASADDKSQPRLEDREVQPPKDEIVYSCTVCKKQYVTLDSLLNHECTVEDSEN